MKSKRPTWQDINNLHEMYRRMIRDWHDRLEKGLSHSSTHLFKELIDVYKEMEKELK